MTDLAAALRAAGHDDVDDSSLARALYSSDASLYRVPPRVVVRPRHPDELLAVLDVARSAAVPVTMRGAGTSIAGNAVGTGIVVDTLKHLNGVVDLDPEARTARVLPGTVHATLQREAVRHGLRFGPDPSTHTRCTIGGMIGNNACGSRALGWGRTSDNVLGLDVVTGTGERLVLGGTRPDSPTLAALDALVDADLARVRTDLGRFTRQVSGYSLEHLLPEQGRSVERFLVGSEGTLAIVLGATVRLVEDPPHRAMAVLGYPSMADAADAVPTLLHHPLLACEGLDSRIVDVVRARGPVPDLPPGEGWLFAEVAGATPAEARAAADAVVRDAGALGARVVQDAAEAATLWRIREDGAGLAASLGGSLSGEHGDGRARSELLPRMYSAEVLDLFARVKGVLDPDDLLNPGVLVAPRPFDADLRLAGPRTEPRHRLRLVHDGGSMADAVHRCTGVGKCLATPAAGGVMCPSFQATRDEKDSTRGRARVLQEMVDGRLVADGWKSPEVHAALDLCLSCKGCSSDCPTGVDMAAYKAEALHQRWKGRLRPRSHYALGRLPRWARMTAPVAPLANTVLRSGTVQRLAKRAAGVDDRRSLPSFSPTTLRRWARRTSHEATAST
ncbi:MAG: FAD-binding and (Fe-S)-binding domain-containing protein, partial [Nocardioides sp.]